MKVYVVLENFGDYDGGTQIVSIYRDKAEATRHAQAARQEDCPIYEVEEHEVI